MITKKIPLPLVFLIFSIALLLGGCQKKPVQPKGGGYEFTKLRRGNIEKTVASTGSLEPIATVSVISQMSGKVEQVLVDYNDTIHIGDVLAILNTDTLKLQREQQRAQVIKARANYELQQLTYQNQLKLAEKNLISDYELRTSKTNLDVQKAELDSAEANLNEIETKIETYAYIKSPIDGIVLDRKINEGETVQEGSSSNASAIFTLAENLSQMRIESWVGELDINSITEGQQVRFTLDAVPGRTFSGEVEKKRLSPSTQDNVVSYNVIIKVNNADMSLLPGMTCAIEFIEDSMENVLLVANAALRYKPSTLSAEQIAAKSTPPKPAEADGASSIDTNTTAPPGGGTVQAGGGIQNVLGGGARPVGMRMPGAGRPNRGGAANTQRNTALAEVVIKPLWYINSAGAPDAVLFRCSISNGSVTAISAFDESVDVEAIDFILREKI